MIARDDEGYVLAATLTALIALGLLAAALIGASSRELRRVRAAEISAAETAALDGALRLAAAELALAPRRRTASFEDGTAQITFAGREIDVTARWESAKLDVNRAGLGELRRAAVASGLDAADQAAFLRTVERLREDETGVRLIDDALSPAITAPECARSVFTVFGGRETFVETSDAAAIGRPAPGSRVVVVASLADRSLSREAVFLMTGDPHKPALVMDQRDVRGAWGREACDGASATG